MNCRHTVVSSSIPPSPPKFSDAPSGSILRGLYCRRVHIMRLEDRRWVDLEDGSVLSDDPSAEAWELLPVGSNVQITVAGPW